MRNYLTAFLFLTAWICLSGASYAAGPLKSGNVLLSSAIPAPSEQEFSGGADSTETPVDSDADKYYYERTKNPFTFQYIYACGATKRVIAAYVALPSLDDSASTNDDDSAYNDYAYALTGPKADNEAVYGLCLNDETGASVDAASDVLAAETVADGDPAAIPAFSDNTPVNPIAVNSVPIVVNRSVESFIKYFQTRGRKHFVTWLYRSQDYLSMCQSILRENGLPEDISYIALIESGFNPKAKSRAKAVGMWQFIKGTAKKYGLRVDWWMDERMAPEKATLAAAKYFKDLYGEFGSWYLAAAGYNAGEGRVRSAVRKHRTDDFWELATYKKPLRRETREYVPKYIAAMLIAKDPAGYGFDEFVAVDGAQGLAYDKVNIPTSTDMSVIAEASGTTVEVIQGLNPELLRWFTPPNYPDYEIKIPSGTKERFLENFPKVPENQRLAFHMHTIKRGDTLSSIAKKYKTDVKSIQHVNNLKAVRQLKVGSTIAIPARPYENEGKKDKTARSDGASA